jgi:hypothetical protein
MQTEPKRSVMASLVLAAVMVLGAVLASAVALPATHVASTSKTATNEQAKPPNVAALTRALHVQMGSRVRAGVISTTSSNWAGYADVPSTSGAIYEAAGEWFSPTVTCGEPKGTAWQASWVGIDGFGNGNVTQAGTLAYCSAPGATPTYWDWYEFYPYESVQLISSSTAGAVVSVYILYNPSVCINGICGVYTIELNDYSNAIYFVTSGGGSVCNSGGCEGGPDATAECISEAPSVGGSIAKLADYGSTTFYLCADTIGTHYSGIGNQSSVGSIYKINQHQTHLDQSTGGLSNYYITKSEFTVTWKAYH